MIQDDPEEIGREIGLAFKNLMKNSSLKYLMITLIFNLFIYFFIVNFLI